MGARLVMAAAIYLVDTVLRPHQISSSTLAPTLKNFSFVSEAKYNYLAG
jgi:hypothetical protein